jgi:hypothetical protein
MSQQEKLVIRLLTIPKDFTWDELTKLLNSFGYEEVKGGKTAGSRRRFADEQKNIITLHKPHPQNIVKSYALREVVSELKAKGHIKDE